MAYHHFIWFAKIELFTTDIHCLKNKILDKKKWLILTEKNQDYYTHHCIILLYTSLYHIIIHIIVSYCYTHHCIILLYTSLYHIHITVSYYYTHHCIILLYTSLYQIIMQSNLSFVTFQGNIEIGSHKTGGHLIQV